MSLDVMKSHVVSNLEEYQIIRHSLVQMLDDPDCDPFLYEDAKKQLATVNKLIRDNRAWLAAAGIGTSGPQLKKTKLRKPRVIKVKPVRPTEIV